ncbi:hypothetical protein ALC57_08773, partial [Trachymyrmex cornetzi]
NSYYQASPSLCIWCGSRNPPPATPPPLPLPPPPGPPPFPPPPPPLGLPCPPPGNKRTRTASMPIKI